MTQYALIGDVDLEHGEPNQAAPIVHKHCWPNWPGPTVHSREFRVLPHHKSEDIVCHDVPSAQEGVDDGTRRIQNPRGNLTHN